MPPGKALFYFHFVWLIYFLTSVKELYNCGVNNVSIFYIFLAHRYRLEIPEPCTIFIPAWGSNWGYSHDQINRDSSGAYVLRPEREDKRLIKTRKMLHSARRWWTHFVCVCFCGCGWQNPEYPQLELHGWRRHYTGHGIGNLGSPFYICGLALNRYR